MIDGQVREEGRNLRTAQLPRMPLVVEDHEATHPLDIRLLGTPAPMPHAQLGANAIEQARRPRRCIRRMPRGGGALRRPPRMRRIGRFRATGRGERSPSEPTGEVAHRRDAQAPHGRQRGVRPEPTASTASSPAAVGACAQRSKRSTRSADRVCLSSLDGVERGILPTGWGVAHPGRSCLSRPRPGRYAAASPSKTCWAALHAPG